MKKFNYISILVLVLLFSCSKEQPVSPISDVNSAQAFTAIPTISDGEVDVITDPEKEDKEKSNKKAKN